MYSHIFLCEGPLFFSENGNKPEFMVNFKISPFIVIAHQKCSRTNGIMKLLWKPNICAHDKHQRNATKLIRVAGKKQMA